VIIQYQVHKALSAAAHQTSEGCAREIPFESDRQAREDCRHPWRD
jgi:hypothetical protein